MISEHGHGITESLMVTMEELRHSSLILLAFWLHKFCFIIRDVLTRNPGAIDPQSSQRTYVGMQFIKYSAQ